MSQAEVVARDGMVTAGHRLAAEAGVEMLRRGGNAVDAASAAAWVVGVVEPWMSGVGGVGAMVVHHAGRQLVADFGLRAPLAARPDMYTLLPAEGPQGQYGWPAVKDGENQDGHRAVGVPGVPAALCLVHQRLGNLPRHVVMQPAISLAANGFEADWYTSLIVGLDLAPLRRFPRAAEIFLVDGAIPPRPSVLLSTPDRIVQRDLAETLSRIATDGPDVFYRGEIAKAIADDMRAHGGLLFEEDLAAYRPRIYDAAARGRYRGLDVLGVPGPTSARVVQGILDGLEGHDLARTGPATVNGLDLIARACRRAYEDFFAHAGTDEHTTHVCAVDRDRNAVSVTLTLGNLFGSHVVVPGTGIVLNDMMLLFDPRPGHANSIAGGKWQATPVAPTLLLDRGRLRAVLGTPGGRRIPTAIAQIIVNLVDRGLGMQDAIAAPRLHAEGAEILLDDRFEAAVFDGLRALGHHVAAGEKTPCSFNFAQPNGIEVGADGRLHGGADPHTPATAVGFATRRAAAAASS